MKGITKVRLLAVGTVIYGAGYLILIASAILGELGGLSGLAAVTMATGILIAMVFGVAFAKTEAELMGEM